MTSWGIFRWRGFHPSTPASKDLTTDIAPLPSVALDVEPHPSLALDKCVIVVFCKLNKCCLYMIPTVLPFCSFVSKCLSGPVAGRGPASWIQIHSYILDLFTKKSSGGLIMI